MSFGEILIYIASYFGLFTSIFFLITMYENKHKLRVPKPKKIYSVSIIVPAYNEEKTIAKTIKSLLNLDYPKDKLEIIIVDDGSKDKTYKISKQFESKNVKVYTKKNGGKGTALNFGLEKSSGELVGALDADSFVAPNALKRIIGYFNDNEVMAVTPSMKVYNPKTILQKIQMIEYLMGIFLRKVFAMLGSIHVTPGPFSIYRKVFFDSYGGFDEKNIAEDQEVALRIQSKKYIIENSETASVYTVSPKNFGDLLRQRIRWYVGFIQNTYAYRHLFGKKHGNLGLFILPGSFISVFLVIILMFYFAYRLVINVSRHLINYYQIRFDFLPLLNFKLDSFYLYITPILILALISLAFGIAIVYIAKKISKEKIKIKFSYIFYLLFYGVLFGLWWLISGIYKIIGKKVYWGKKNLNEC